jgi:hypothetical protein
MQVEGITWHGVTLEPNQFTAMGKLCREVFGLAPMTPRTPARSRVNSACGFSASII